MQWPLIAKPRSRESLYENRYSVTRRRGALKDEFVFFFQAEDGIRDYKVTGVQTCALPIFPWVDRAQAEHDAFAEVLRSRGVDVLLLADALRTALQDDRAHAAGVHAAVDDRSEERRVGKEGRSRWSPYH